MPSTKEMFDIVLRLLDREDQLINSRMTWYLTIQGFLVASAALAFSGKFESRPQLQTPAIISLSILGIAISAVVYVAVHRARNNKKKVGSFWRKTDPETANFPDPRGDISRWSILTPGQTVPIIFVIFWIAVMIGVVI